MECFFKIFFGSVLKCFFKCLFRENLACLLANFASKPKKGKSDGAAQELKSQNPPRTGDAGINSKIIQKSRSRLSTNNIAGKYRANGDCQGNISPASSCSGNLLSGVVKQNQIRTSPPSLVLEAATPTRATFDTSTEGERSMESGTAEFSPSCSLQMSIATVGASPSAMGRVSSSMNNVKANVPHDLLLRNNAPVNQYPSPTNQISPFASSPMAITSPQLINSPTPTSEIYMKKCEIMGYGNANCNNNANTRKRKVSNNQQGSGISSSYSMVSPIPAKMPAMPLQSSPTIPQQQIVYQSTMRQQHVAAAIPPPQSPSLAHSPRQKLQQEQPQNWSAQMMSPSPIGYPPTPSPKLPPSPVKQNQHTMQSYQGSLQSQMPNGYLISPSASSAAKSQHYLSPEKCMELQCSPVRQFQVRHSPKFCLFFNFL